ncbi:MAG: DsrE/DsrF/DrsH-like family protein [Gammaproteobacteria bacterium]|nr:DsrE/DsrF/DrsH-like family protein [Gammaproteobacteria bacterium]
MHAAAHSVPATESTDLAARVAQLEARMARAPDPDGMTLLVFSGELDKLLAAFTIANGAAATGMSVRMFFTFWGAAALKERTLLGGKSLVERAFGLMLPGGLKHRALSRMDMLGVGRRLMAREMRRKNVALLPELVAQAASLGVEIYLCEMSMEIMGIAPQELIDYPNIQYCGAVKFADLAASGNTSLFI